LDLWIPDNTLRPFLFGPPTLICGHFIQVYTTYKGFGSIRKKPEIYALPLKRKPGPRDRNMEAVMERMFDMEEKIIEDRKEIPWYQGKNVHWYIISEQHTVESFRKIASREPVGSAQREEFLKFEIIPVFSKDPAMLTRVSTTLNLNITNRVVKEVYHQNIELGRAKWIEGRSPMPHRGGGKAPQLEIHSAHILDPFVIDLFLTSLWPSTVFLSADGRYCVCRKSRHQFLLTLLVRAQ
jgi:hypothetical protein